MIIFRAEIHCLFSYFWSGKKKRISENSKLFYCKDKKKKMNYSSNKLEYCPARSNWFIQGIKLNSKFCTLLFSFPRPETVKTTLYSGIKISPIFLEYFRSQYNILKKVVVVCSVMTPSLPDLKEGDLELIRKNKFQK